MTERLAEITARINGVRQLGAVVNAMRGIAAARAQQARQELSAADSYAATIAGAIGRTRTLLPGEDDSSGRRKQRLALVLFCAEQGFAGAFSEHIFEAAADDLADAEIFLVGTRGAMLAQERRILLHWQGAAPSHTQAIPALADRIATALYGRIAIGAIDRLDAIFGSGRQSQGEHVSRVRLFPLDLAAFPAPASQEMPLLNLPPRELLRDLTADYIHAQLCHAALHAFAAENEARMEAMAAAHRQIDRQLDNLQATQRQIRQDEITAEIIELAAGETAQASIVKG